MIECQPFADLSEIPYAELLDASLPKMDAGTYDWSIIDATTAEEKRAFITNHLTGILDHPEAFACAVSIDSEVLLAVFGTRSAADLIAALSLGRPDSTGSRAYIWRQDVRRALFECLEASGFRRMIGFMPKGSTLKDDLNKRDNRGTQHYQSSPTSDAFEVYVHWDIDERPSERNWA